ncbi:NUDIX domain-containing protein [Parabacteroides sp. OttesenSCG-928-N08]|nr:NUDIX domain-containing protein [Parabacteroides sp. OttesenSCG-928-N08]
MSAAFYQEQSRFYVAVDCIILGFSNNELNVLLYKRNFEPLMGQWSLMGGFVRAEENVSEAASRVLIDCTGIDNIYMEQIGAYGDITRDLGERVISIAYYALVDMKDFDSELLQQYNASWVNINELPELVFDHRRMIDDTMNILRQKAAIQPLGFNLLPEKFTLTQLQNLYETIYQHPLDKRNFRKKLLSMDILEKLEEKDRMYSKRGAYLYTFNVEKYNRMLKEGFYFSL